MLANGRQRVKLYTQSPRHGLFSNGIYSRYVLLDMQRLSTSLSIYTVRIKQVGLVIA